MKFEEDVKKFHGQTQNAIAAQMNPPRRMLTKRGNKAEPSVPAEMEFAEMFVPT